MHKIYLLLSSLIFCMPAMAIADADITDLSIEQLPQTTFIPASRIANQISNAPSAVSIVTADDIKTYGYRTLGELLNSMRGVFVTQDYAYQFLGGRGYGFPGEYSGRITLLIDGYRTQDSYYGQAYFGNDGLLDMTLIERVEYIPGSGSNGYGDGATLGVVNVVTKKGSAFNGGQVAVSAASHSTNHERFTYGKQLENGADILFSSSRYYSRGRSFSFPESALLTAGTQAGDNSDDNYRLFFKGSYQGLALETGLINRSIELPSAPLLGIYTEPATLQDKNGFVWLKYDTDLNPTFKLSAQTYYGQYDSHYHDVEVNSSTVTQWHGIDLKLVNTSFDRHTLVAGVEYKNDNTIDVSASDSFGVYFDERMNRKTYSVYGYDSITLNSSLTLNLGVRYDASDNNIRMLSPRGAIIYKPIEATTLKFSTGQTKRQATPFEQSGMPQYAPERTNTTELVWEQNLGWQSKLTASVYQYKVIDRILASDSSPDVTSKGVELEYEKIWENGTHLLSSYAKQYAKNSFGDRTVGSPRDNAKLNLSVPVMAEKLRAGLAVRYLGRRRTFLADYVFTGGYTVADLTLTTTHFLPRWSASFTVKNLFDRNYGDVTSNILFDERPLLQQDGRNFWLQLEYDFK